MDWWVILLIIFAVIIVIPYTIMIPLMPFVLRKMILMRTDKDKWSRDEWQKSSNEQTKDMNRIGNKFRADNIDKKKDVSIVSEGYKLVGEYYDFGGKGCAIFLGGRCDTLTHNAYYVAPYVKAGYNILLIDVRSHGLSEGEFFGAGISEVPDSIAWIKYAHDELHNEEVVLHGVCIGGQAWLLAAANKDFPSYVKSITADGLYLSFYTLFKRHVRKSYQPTWPYVPLFRALIKKKHGIDIKLQSVQHLGQNIKTPVLVLGGKKDKYVPNKDTIKAFETLGSSKKKILFFEDGPHSHFRINNEEAYDQTIIDWLKEI